MPLIPARLFVVAVAVCLGVSQALAQTGQAVPEVDPKRAPAEKVEPRESLSEKLNRTEGVIRPPAGIDPDIKVPAPVPNPGTTIVIPPPGTPGHPDQSKPK